MSNQQQSEKIGRHAAANPLIFLAAAVLAIFLFGLAYVEIRAAQRKSDVTRFMATCLSRDYETASRLIQKNSWMTEFRLDSNGKTLLHWAALQPDTTPSLLLLQHGAKVNAADDAGRTPYQYATDAKNAFVARILRRRGGLDGLNIGNGPLGSQMPAGAAVQRSHLGHRPQVNDLQTANSLLGD